MTSSAITIESGVDRQTRWPLYLLLFGVFFLSQPFDLLFTVHGEITAADNARAVEDGSPLRRLGLTVLAVTGVYGIASGKAGRLRMKGPLSWLLVFFLAWAMASIIWSDQPAVTARKVGTLLILYLGAIGGARLMTFTQLAEFTVVGASLAMFMGLGCEMALGTWQPWDGEYRFAGLMFPAFSAWTMSLLFIALLTLWKKQAIGKVLFSILASVTLVCILLTRTRASVAAFVVGLATWLMFIVSSRRLAKIGYFTATFLAAIFLAFSLLGLDTARVLGNAANLGRESESISDLTGRTEIWHDLVPDLLDRLWIGHGYESYWTPQRLYQFEETQDWAVPDSHNGYIELTLGTGLIGSATYCLILAVSVIVAAWNYFRSGDAGYAFAAGAVAVLAANSLCVATEVEPYLFSYITLALIARFGFVEPTNSIEVDAA
jgi:exopolysaccharide production protein ExoQ